MLAGKRADEQIAVPRGKHLARVERDAAGRDVRRPEVHGLLETGLRRFVAVDRLAGVVASVADDREAVVLASLDLVDLVAAARTVLGGPQPAGLRMNRDAAFVAEA